MKVDDGRWYDAILSGFKWTYLKIIATFEKLYYSTSFELFVSPFEYIFHLFSNKNQNLQSPETETLAVEDGLDDLDGFELIELDDCIDEIDYERFPWLKESHPLYFPPMFSVAPTSKSRIEAINLFSVGKWYASLKDYTFKSEFLDLNLEDIQYLAGKPTDTNDAKKLEQKLDMLISTFKQKKVFMRLSTRSPKDSKYLFDRATNIMEEDTMYWTEINNQNQQMVSFVHAMTKAMQFSTGKEIIVAIQDSPRVQHDLLTILNASSLENQPTQIVLREWYDIRPDHEFRVFVSKRDREQSIVTAISQYFHFLYFDKNPKDSFNTLSEDIHHHFKKQVEDFLLNIIDPEMAKLLDFNDRQNTTHSAQTVREYVIDLALIPCDRYEGTINETNMIQIGGDQYVLQVIELNPFSPFATGSSLFDWTSDLDLLWGQSQAEYPILKMRNEPRLNFNGVTLLPANYNDVIDAALCRRPLNSEHSGLDGNKTFDAFTHTDEKGPGLFSHSKPEKSANLVYPNHLKM